MVIKVTKIDNPIFIKNKYNDFPIQELKGAKVAFVNSNCLSSIILIVSIYIIYIFIYPQSISLIILCRLDLVNQNSRLPRNKRRI